MVIISELTRELLSLEEVVVDFVLNQSAKQQYRQGNIAKKELAPYVELIKEMSTRYVGVQNVKLSQQQVAAYALYYLPINFAKLAFLLSQNITFTSDKAVRVLDFGCGPGTAALAAAYSIKQALEITLNDASNECINFASKLLKSCRKETTVKKCLTSSLPPEQRFDLVIAANVISEIPEKERVQVLESLIQHVDPGGYLLLLVPALKSTTQALMQIRDRILEQHKEFAVTFPCSIQSACPMRIENQDDWCHGELLQSSWQRSSLIKQFDDLLGFNKHRVKYACLIFQRAEPPAYSGLRILRPSSKSHPALLCGEDGLLRIDARRVANTEARRALKNGNSYQLIDKTLLDLE